MQVLKRQTDYSACLYTNFYRSHENFVESASFYDQATVADFFLAFLYFGIISPSYTASVVSHCNISQELARRLR